MSEDLHALTGAYVLDALDDDERAAFEAYMATSPATAAEVESLRSAVGMLGAAVAETPPEGLRRSVMDAVDQTRQLPPAAPEPDADDRAEDLADVVPLRAGTPWLTRLAMGAAAVAVTVSLGLGLALANLNQRLDSLEGSRDEVATLLAARDTAHHEAGLPDGGVVFALISDEHGAAVAVAEGLPQLDTEQMYALWGFVDGLPVPVGELVNGQPVTVRHAGLDGLGLTVEPRGELTLPTGAVQATLGV